MAREGSLISPTSPLVAQTRVRRAPRLASSARTPRCRSLRHPGGRRPAGRTDPGGPVRGRCMWSPPCGAYANGTLSAYRVSSPAGPQAGRLTISQETGGPRHAENGRFDSAIQTYAWGVIRWRWPIMLVTVLLVAVAASGGRFVWFNTDYRAFFSDENPQLNPLTNCRTYTARTTTSCSFWRRRAAMCFPLRFWRRLNT